MGPTFKCSNFNYASLIILFCESYGFQFKNVTYNLLVNYSVSLKTLKLKMVSKAITGLFREGLRINSRMIKITYLIHTHGSVVMQNDERKYYNEVGLWIHG